MKIIGIIAEYNPFHNGHMYQLQKSVQDLGADGVIVVMSGNFVQRGYPAFLDKWKRTEMAISAGVNLVIELPTYYATSSAEQFAFGAVNLLNATGCVDYLSFGSEMDNLEKLKIIAHALAFETPEFKASLKNWLSSGLSYPQSREKALFENAIIENTVDESLKINQSNTILSIEYLKALYQSSSLIEPYMVKRIGKNYHDESTDSPYVSATAIRKTYFEHFENFDAISYMPENPAALMDNLKYNAVSMKDFESQLLYIIRRLSAEELSTYREVNEGLEFKIKNISNHVTSYESLVEGMKSKRYTHTKISRLLLNILLGIKKEPIDINQIGYIRVLGADATGQKILHEMKDTCSIPVITNINNHKDFLKDNALLKLDLVASDLYQLAQKEKHNQIGGRDHTERIIIK